MELTILDQVRNSIEVAITFFVEFDTKEAHTFLLIFRNKKKPNDLS